MTTPLESVRRLVARAETAEAELAEVRAEVSRLREGLRFIVADAEQCPDQFLKCDAKIVAMRLLEGSAFAPSGAGGSGEATT